MVTAQLENKAYKLVMEGRWRFTRVVAVVLCIFALAGYVVINNILPTDAWWFLPLLGLIGLAIKLGASSFTEYLDSISSVYCPSCSKLIEKQQIIGNPMPKSCEHCGMRICRI